MDNNENEKIDKISVIKKENINHYQNIFDKKIINLQEIIKRTILAVQKYKIINIFGANELNICIQTLENIFLQLNILYESIKKKQEIDTELYINKIQEITNELSSVFHTFGTENIDDLIYVCFGNEFISNNFKKQNIIEKYNVMKNYVHPISYKVMHWKSDTEKQDNIHVNSVVTKSKSRDDFTTIKTCEDLECFDLARTSNSFQTKVHGIKFIIHNNDKQRTLIICGIVDDIMTSCLNNIFIIKRLQSIKKNKPKSSDFNEKSFDYYLNSITLKELLIYSDSEIYDRYMGYINEVYLIKQKTISQVTKEFISSELYFKRMTLIQLLLKSDETEFQYLAYLLYDLLSDDSNGKIDTKEQNLLFDSLPLMVKKYFRDAMKQTINYTNTITNSDDNKIPLEQQICFMKASDSVKEKAMLKLKEVKAKSEDSGSKARHYLDGLIKIPFGIYKEEPILKIIDECTNLFNDLIKNINNALCITEFPIKEKYTSFEMRKYITLLKNNYSTDINHKIGEIIKNNIINLKRHQLITNICDINLIIKKYNLKMTKICHSGKKIEFMRENINKFIDAQINNNEILMDYASKYDINKELCNTISNMKNTFIKIDEKTSIINKFMETLDETLDNAVHGHKKAKRQIERIIGQWINGKNNGYCFGFEGPPGTGKTSLAKKGIANCLKDEQGNSRPFSFIAIGGSSNGSTLEGHNYTYVGSTWGRIVDILMENKCMNPIIFIDELDKVSRTENGKEIIGILTHLIDQTQNDSFQDKYFNGIDLDLSKALFIFSYNDVDAIDRILLDRIHRIKFDHLSLDDKLIITKNYLFPEIYKKMGLEGVIEINDDVVEYIIDEWTNEPGVRKLKEILFEIVGEINISILRNSEDYSIPIKITRDDIKYKFLKGTQGINIQQIHREAKIGLINGLWANSYGRGGVLPIEAKYYPCGSFLELKLSGLQGDVMKESMSVAKTLAWSLLTKDEMKKIQKEMNETKYQGIHIHVPEGATPKNGPSAGTAITVVLYSLFANKQIRHDIAITGEICLQGKVYAIGGLDLKILGGIRAGVKCFIFPKDNKKDFKEFIEKYENKSIIKDIEFKQVETIQEVLDIIFID